jgi:hypothetical protein
VKGKVRGDDRPPAGNARAAVDEREQSVCKEGWSGAVYAAASMMLAGRSGRKYVDSITADPMGEGREP